MAARLADFRVLIVPGLHDSGPGHWHSHWQELYPSFERVEQRHWDIPDLDAWSAQIGHVLRRSARPTVIVAHSFGCLATVHRVIAGAPKLYGALLVAPADPAKFGIDDASLQSRLPFSSAVIASEDDPWMALRRSAFWAGQWGSEFIAAGALGHINADSGLGDWLFGQAQLQRLVQRIPMGRACGCGASPGNAPSISS
jgi:predicted alpha/beta hydrolase family esterase